MKNTIPERYKFISNMEWENFLTEEELMICEIVGLEGFLNLLEHFKGMPVYFTEDRIDKMKKEFIRRNPDNLSKKELAKITELSLMTIYRYAGNGDNDPGLFDHK
ncbi:MAG: hypothetical protein K9J12_12490 [Melioribacteraceae bacterium]|nr:hypothetical protein [Melioribacteraceae bacterium]MCF8265832.1 hypothetical protein [Melioribacteraceae bacterium]MCF8414528.1 hypothetical protein [Melioribacteraceae bacterium]MCF8430536.1 hypothetical protein [Melioribacteraceae bacterium]